MIYINDTGKERCQHLRMTTLMQTHTHTHTDGVSGADPLVRPHMAAIDRQGRWINGSRPTRGIII